jgi:hypothetical protein
MVCIKCGQEFDEGTKFCTKCGFGVNNTAPGNKFLKITGILFIVLGVYRIISLIANIVTSGIMASVASELGVPAISGFTIFLSVLNVLLSLFLGITGVMYCKDIKKAKLLKYFAFGYIGFYVIFSINSVVTTVASFTSIKNATANESDLSVVASSGIFFSGMFFVIIGIIIGFVIPILYLIGTKKNLEAQEGQ